MNESTNEERKFERTANPFAIFLSGWLQILEVTVFIVVATLAILSISEISARQSFSGLLESNISRLQSEFVERTRSSVSPGAPQVTSSTKDLSPAEESYRLLKDIAYQRDLLSGVKSLITLGAEKDSQTLRAIRKQNDRMESEDLNVAEAVRYVSGLVLKWLSIIGLDVKRMSSDNLLALAVMCCGAIGALVAGMRQRATMTLRNLTLGLSTGFIVYLGIRGGKFVFLLQASGELIPFNPYGSGFVGLLAGLFTERAYRFLSNLVDQVVKRVETALKG
jgi:hypothetical protein